MAARRSSCGLALLLALLLPGAPAAALSPEEAARRARTEIDRAQFDLAERTIDDTRSRLGSRQDEIAYSLLVMRAEVFIARRSLPEALQLLRDEPPVELRKSASAVRRLLMLGFASRFSKDHSKNAAPLFREALALALRHQPQTLPEVYARLASAAEDPKDGVKYAMLAIPLARQYGDRVNEMKAMASLAYQYVSAGRYQESIYWGEKALPIARSLPNDKSVGQIEGNLGWACREIGDYEYAAELFRDAYAIAVRLKAEDERIAWLIQLGNVRLQQGDWAGADRDYREAVERARVQKHDQLAIALANVAVIAIETKRFAEARKFNTEALRLKLMAGQTESALRSMILDARITAATGDPDAAVKKLQGVIAQAKQESTVWEARGRLGEAYAAANRVDLAAEQFRSAVSTARNVRKTIIRDDLNLSFFNTTEEIFDTAVDVLVDHNRLYEALVLTERIRADAREIDFDRTAPSMTAIARRENATILSYWLGPKRSYLWKITPNEIRVATLPPENTIRDAVDGYRRAILNARGELQFIRSRGEELHKLLGIPGNLAPGSRVIVIPDGNLNALNFETLVVRAPKPHYWIEDVNLMAASSIQLLARREHPANPAPRMLLIGNPPQSDPAFPLLPRAGEEIASISAHFPASRLKVLDRAAATPAAYQRALPQTFDFVHFVAHGVATRRRPLESAVILGADATNNYRLVAREILKQPLRARLVTISSCHGAGTRAYTGEGLVGLAWAFLRAGASNVIAALWEVNDSATPQLMDDVYRAIGRGSDPATALREAKLVLLRSGGAYRKPRYWAPFVLYAGR